MTKSRSREDAKYWLRQADERLEQARGYVAGGNARIYCEQAHYAAEFSIKAVIISRGESFATTHNIKELVDTARACPPGQAPESRRRPSTGRRRRGCPPKGYPPHRRE